MADSINLGTLYSVLELRIDRLEKGVADAKHALTDLEKSAKSTAERINKNLAESAKKTGESLSKYLTVPLLAFGAAAIKSAATMDGLRRGLTAVAGSSQAAEVQLKRLKEVAKLPGLGMEEAVRGSINLQAAGLSAKEAERSLMAFGNALATVGKGKVELDRVNYALSQLVNRTSGFGEEIRQLQEHLPQIRQVMIKAFGTADSEILAKGKMTGRQFVEGITAEFEKLPKVVGGAQNSFENFSDSAKRALASIGDVFLPHVTKAADFLAQKFESIADAMKVLPQQAQNSLSGLFIGGLIMGPAILGVSKLLTLVTSIKAALANPIVLRLTVVAVGLAALLEAVNQLRNTPSPQQMAQTQGGRDIMRGMLSGVDKETQDKILERWRTTPAAAKTMEGARNRLAKRLVPEDPFGPENFLKTPGAKQGPIRPGNADRNRHYLQQQLNLIDAEIKAVSDTIPRSNTESEKLGRQLDTLAAKHKSIKDKLDALDLDKQERAGAKSARQSEGVMGRLMKGLYGGGAGLGNMAGNVFDKAIPKAFEDARRALDDLLDSLSGVGSGVQGGLSGIEAIGELRDRLFEMTHDKFAVQSRDAERQLLKDWSVSWVDAARVYIKSLADIRRAQEEFVRDPGSGIGAGLAGVAENLPGIAAAQGKAGRERIVGAGQGIGGGLGAIGTTVQAHFERAQEAMARRFNFGREFGQNLAEEFAYGFSSSIEKALGRNPIGRAFARALDRALVGVFDNLFSKLLGGGRGLNGIAGPTGIGGGDLFGGILNMGLSGLITGGFGSLFGGLFGGGKKGGGGGVGGILGGIGSVLGFDTGGVVPGPRGSARLAMVHGGETILPTHRGGGAGMVVNLNGFVVREEADIYKISREVGRQMQRQFVVRNARGF